MALKTTVKVSHISNLSNARYCAGMGVAMLGFRVIPGAEDYIPPDIFQEIRGWIAGPAIVAELYGLAEPSYIPEVIRNYSPDYFELTLHEYENFGRALSLPCIITLGNTRLAPGILSAENVSHAIVGEDTTCEDIAGLSVPALASITTAHGLHKKLDAECFAGVVLDGPREIRPGVTSYEQLGAILEALED